MAAKQPIYKLYLSLLIILTFLSPYAGAEEREDQLIQQRLTKLKKIETPKQGMFEKFMLRVENQFGEEALQGGKLGARAGFGPRIGMISSGSGVAGGIRFGNNFLQSSAAYSFRGYQEYDAQIGFNPPMEGVFLKGYFPRDPFRSGGEKPGPFLYADLRYRHFPQEDFFGIGPDSSGENRTDYLFQEGSVQAIGGYRFGRLVRVDFRTGELFQNIGSGTDRRFANTEAVFGTNVPGLVNEPNLLTFGSSVLLDYRDRPGNPHSGGAVGVIFLRFDDRGGNLYEFNRVNFDARHFIPLGSPARVLALRFLASFSDASGDHVVPFYMMETLGGSHTLRGFDEMRFRDKHLMHMTAEYRFEAATWLELAAFYDAGKVFARRSEFDFTNLERGYGGGVRFKSADGVILRMDVGKSSEGIQVYLKLGSSF
jgi:hypothetical protein